MLRAAMIMLCLVGVAWGAPVEIGEGRQPQLSVDQEGRVYLAYARGEEIVVRVSKDEGRTFDPPAVVGKLERVMVGKRRGPRVAAGEGFVVVTAIANGKASDYPGDLVAWRSADGGKTWSRPARVNGVERSAREGLHHLVSDGGRRVYAVWLDLRGDGMRVEGALSRDGGITWEGNETVYESPDGHVCECCQPAVTFLPDGRVAVMFRNWLEGNRDMFVATFQPGAAASGVKVAKVGSGSWKLNACPMDGGAIAADEAGGWVAVWRREGTVYLSKDGEKTERVLGEGMQGWVAGRDVVWMTGRNGKVVHQRGEGKVRDLAAAGTDPVLVRAKRESVAAWEANGRVYSDVIPDRNGK